MRNAPRNIISYCAALADIELIYPAQLIQCVAPGCWIFIVSELIHLPFNRQLYLELFYGQLLLLANYYCISLTPCLMS